jgi:hypothetical protein
MKDNIEVKRVIKKELEGPTLESFQYILSDAEVEMYKKNFNEDQLWLEEEFVFDQARRDAIRAAQNRLTRTGLSYFIELEEYKN